MTESPPPPSPRPADSSEGSPPVLFGAEGPRQGALPQVAWRLVTPGPGGGEGSDVGLDSCPRPEHVGLRPAWRPPWSAATARQGGLSGSQALQGQAPCVIDPSFLGRVQGWRVGLFMITPTVAGSVSHRRERKVSPGSDVGRSTVYLSSRRASSTSISFWAFPILQSCHD